MTSSHAFKIDVSNSLKNPNATQPKAYPYVRTLMPSVPIIFETGETNRKRSEDVCMEDKREKFDKWKSSAEKFSWELFAIPTDLVEKLKGGIKGTAPNLFRTYASGVIKKNGWKPFHGMMLWSLLPEKYKNAWKAAAELGGAQETSKSASSCTEVPDFNNIFRYNNDTCAYFTFQAAPEPSAFPVVDAGNNNEPGTSREASSTSQHTCDTLKGAILHTDTVIHTQDDNYPPILNLLDSRLGFDDDLVSIGRPLSPGMGVQKYPLTSDSPINTARAQSPAVELVTGLTDSPTFGFGAYSVISSRSFTNPPIPEDLALMRSHDEQRPVKRRRRNRMDSTGINGYIPTMPSSQGLHMNSAFPVPSDGLDNFFGFHAPPLPSLMPKLQVSLAQRRFGTQPDNPPTIGRESTQKLCNHQGITSSMHPWSQTEATMTSSPLLNDASTSTDVHFQASMEEHRIATPRNSVFLESSEIAPLRFTSVIGSGQSDDDDTLHLASGTIAEILSVLTHQPTAEYLTNSVLETQECPIYEFPGGFGL